jgi:sporulation protein YlmC with PRC-barrel domain
VGKLKEIYLDKNNSKISYFLITLHKKISKNMEKKNILVDYKYVQSVKEVIIINHSVFDAISNFLATTDKDLNNKT